MKIYTQQEWKIEVAKNKKEINTTDFETACSYFRQICKEIGDLIGNNQFKGGYDDMISFYSHNAYKTDKGVQLAIAWSGCNQLCKYEGELIGLSSPEWWYKCWQNN